MAQEKSFLDSIVDKDGIKMDIGFDLMDIVFASIGIFVAITTALVVATQINKRL